MQQKKTKWGEEKRKRRMNNYLLSNAMLTTHNTSRIKRSARKRAYKPILLFKYVHVVNIERYTL